MRVLEPEQPDTLTSIAHLASTFWNQSQWKEADELFVQVIKTSSRLLGPEHPDTLTRMDNLAFTYQNQGREEALQSMIEVAQYRLEKLGSDHPDTIQSICTLHEWQAKKT